MDTHYIRIHFDFTAKPNKQTMSAFDGNRDGYLNPLERADQNEFRFGDANRDGALNFQEFARTDSMYQCSLREIIEDSILFFEDPQEFGLYDTNRDGLVDAPEYARGEALTEHRCKCPSDKFSFTK